MWRSPLFLVVAALIGASFISFVGSEQGWSPLTIFLLNTLYLGMLAVIRRGITRPLMVGLIVIQAIPVWGLGTVAALAPPIILLIVAIMWRTFVGRLQRSRLVPREDREVAPGARRPIDELIFLGFQSVGSADAIGPGYETTFSYLVSADRRTYAIATDRLQTLASTFGERVLVTTDRASMPVPPSELRQLIPKDVPELYEAHKYALEVVSRSGHQPDHLVPARVIEQSHLNERRSLNYLAARPWWVAVQTALGVVRRQPPDSRPITFDPESSCRIEAWLDS
ncbi:MAG: hypothetical protein ACRDWH_07260 [Acidimicrobiia bacterium]